jgi:polysaccharide biosynthesis protein VpsQ
MITLRKSIPWLALGGWLLVILLVYLADIGQAGTYFGIFYHYPGGDKLGHFLVMGLLSLLTNWALGTRRMTLLGQSWLVGSLLVAGIVSLEELSQYWFEVRTCSWLDWFADLLGIWLGGKLATYSWVKVSSGKL